MARKVLIPLDGSVESEEVIPLVKDELADDDELLLIQVIPPGRTQTIGDHVILGSQVEEGDLAQARRYLQDVLKRESDGPGIWKSDVVISSSVAEGIANAANQQQADLIAMYTHDRNLLGRMIKGSIAREVQRKASTKVRILGPRQLNQQPGVSADPDEVVTDGGAFAHLDIFRGMSAQHIQRVVALGHRIQVAAGEKQGRRGCREPVPDPVRGGESLSPVGYRRNHGPDRGTRRVLPTGLNVGVRNHDYHSRGGHGPGAIGDPPG